MDKQLDVRFDRVEHALSSLIESITRYNPTTEDAHRFAAADAELSKGLEDLQTHQLNYRRIEQLRAATSNLDGQIKDTLRLLANTRKELVNAPATIFPDGPQYDIKYDELLNYARMISKTTIPPAGAINALSAEPPSSTLDNDGLETAATTPGGGGTAVGTPNGVQSSFGSAGPGSASQSFDPASQNTANSGAAALPEPLHAHLNPNSQIEFVPWPNEENIRQGGLASLAFLAERNINPENYDPEEEKARKEREEEEKRQREEQERLQQEERARQAREEQARSRAELERRREKEAEEWRRSSAGGNPPSATPAGEKKQFHFMDDDDDDSDS